MVLKLEEHIYPIAPSLVPAMAGGALPPDVEPEHDPDKDPAKRPAWLGRWALGLAALLHLLPVILYLLAQIAFHPALQPPAIQVTLVQAPPKAPPPPPAQPVPPQMAPRESGADDKTQAKKTPKDQPALPRSGSPQDSQANAAPAAPRLDQQPAMKDHIIHLPQPGGNADRDLAGDPYLNRMMQMIERNRVFPPASDFEGPNGRLAIYSIVIEPSGAISLITLLSSSGVPRIDEAARLMITSSAPFPPLPSDYPQIRTRIVVEIPMYPRGGQS
jgi:TonB family protein